MREGKGGVGVEEKGPPPALGAHSGSGPWRRQNTTPTEEHQPQLQGLCFPPADPQEKVPKRGRPHLHRS